MGQPKERHRSQPKPATMRLLLALLLLPSLLRAGSANLAFDYSQQPVQLAYAKIYVGTNPAVLVLLPPGSTSITNRLTNLVDGVTNWAYATVVSAGQVESSPSASIAMVAPFAPSARLTPLGLSSIWLPSTGGVVQVSRDLEQWRERLTLRPSTNGGYLLGVSPVADQPALYLRAQPPPLAPPLPQLRQVP